MQTEEWAQRIKSAGLEPVAIPLLEVTRALGFVAAHLMLLSQPLLVGLVDRSVFEETTEWLEDPQRVGQLLDRLERGEERS